jgi:hypothetical protein
VHAIVPSFCDNQNILTLRANEFFSFHGTQRNSWRLVPECGSGRHLAYQARSCQVEEVGAYGEMTTMSGTDDNESNGIAPAVAQQIDENLKRLYSDATSEDLPPSLTELLNALREKDAQEKSGDE